MLSTVVGSKRKQKQHAFASEKTSKCPLWYSQGAFRIFIQVVSKSRTHVIQTAATLLSICLCPCSSFSKEGKHSSSSLSSPLPPTTLLWLKCVPYSGFSFKTKPLGVNPILRSLPHLSWAIKSTVLRCHKSPTEKKIIFREAQFKRQFSVHSVQTKVFQTFQA